MSSKIIFQTILLTIMLGQNLTGQFQNFITAKDGKLFDGEKEFRFISFNIPNLHYIEDYLLFDNTNPWRLPDEFEIRDALTTIKHLGGKAARIYTLSVRKDSDNNIIRHVEAPGKFSEQAFVALDKVLKTANELGIRIIIPFVDNWSWWGGIKEYAAFRDKSASAFWYDEEIKNDFRETIKFVINRKNSLTGQLYKDDKAILAWETGNELEAPSAWTKEITGFIKSLDTNHLVIEGTFAKDLSQDIIEDPNIDILSTHHYGNVIASIDKIVSNQKSARGVKPYFIGEFGIIPTQDIRAIADTIINQNLSGGLLWSLRFHNRDGGFYHHYEYNDFESYRFPGFSNGAFYDEREVLNLIRTKAYEIDNLTLPRIPLPSTPYLLDSNDITKISWQGSTGADFYQVERKEEFEENWIVVSNVDESKYQYRPLFNDITAKIGKRYFYRIKAVNKSGESDYSNIIGPVDVNYKAIIDEMENFDFVFQKEGKLKLLVTEDLRKAKEDRSRLTGNDSSYVIYKSPSDLLRIVVDAFITKNSSGVELYSGANLDSMKVLSHRTTTFSFPKNDYDFFDAVRFDFDKFDTGERFFKVILQNDIQISRIEIYYR